MTRSSVLGNGFKFPLQLDANAARPLMASEEELVKADMKNLLSTDIQERPFLVRNGVPYGTRMFRVLFESLVAARDTAQFDVSRALRVWEPRIIVMQVNAVIQDNAVIVDVLFRYRSTNRVDNFVMPYRVKPLTANSKTAGES